MIRIITTKRLDALQAEAAHLPELRDQVAAAQEKLRIAEANRAEATTEMQRLHDAVVTDLADLKLLANDPVSGSKFQADFALKFLRKQIAAIKKTGDIEAINGLWLLDLMINNDAADGDERAEGTETTAAELAQQHRKASEMTAYDTAPDLYDEQQELVRRMARLPLREKLLRLAALADRGTLDVPELDDKALQPIRSAALRLAVHDQTHGTAAGPVDPAAVDVGASLETLRAYVRQEYAAWRSAASALNNPNNHAGGPVTTTTAFELPIGTPVRYWTGFREGDGKASRTRTAVQAAASGTPVVWVKGEGSFIAMTHVQEITEEELEAALKAQDAAKAASGALDPQPATTRENDR